jgi:hypothetical protein
MTDTKQLEIPKANMPILTRCVSADPMGSADLITWEIEKDHPITQGLRVIRMFRSLNPPGVEVYGADPNQPKMGARTTIPWHLIKIVEEVFDAASFVNEIAEAEAEADEEGDPAANGPLPS